MQRRLPIVEMPFGQNADEIIGVQINRIGIRCRDVVPEPSDRCTIVISVPGSFTPGFSFAIAGSFHFVILPWKMSAAV